MQERKDQMIKEKHGRMLWENFEELIFLLPNYLAWYFNLVLMMKATFFCQDMPIRSLSVL